MPSSLLATAPRRENADPMHTALLRKLLSISFTKIVVSWDMYVVRPAFKSGDINVGVGCFVARANNTRGSGCMSLGATYTSVMNINAGPFSWDRWVHLELTLPADSFPSLRIDGGAPLTGRYDTSVEIGDPFVQIELGIQSYNKPAPELTVSYDNLVIDVF